MTIEKALDELAKDGSTAVIMKANKGYAAVLCNRAFYNKNVLLKAHCVGETILEALKELIKIYREEEVDDESIRSTGK